MHQQLETTYQALFDQRHYERRAGRRFLTRDAALEHYASEGEAAGLDPSPYFDVAHYRLQLGEVLPAQGLLRHYAETGHREGCNPTPFFEQDWYAWQNPDALHAHDNAYLHYLETGRNQKRDPSPRVDMVLYEDSVGAKRRSEHYELILAGLRSPAMGVYDGWDDLERAQNRFREAISVYISKANLAGPPRRSLVFLQCGPQSRHREWLNNEPRDWDLLVNYYDAAGFDAGVGEYVFFQPGTKFTAISKLWQSHSGLFLKYDHVLFLDDDILVSTGKLNRLFEICREKKLDLAQMTLSENSHCVWKLFYSQPSKTLRYVSGVEIMMPVLSRRALIETGRDFSRSVSGFGLDLLAGKKLINDKRDNIAVIDQVVAEHTKPIDQGGGGYYSYLRSRHINAKAELWHLVTTFGLDRGFKAFE